MDALTTGELAAVLALGQDSSFDQPLETQARSTLLAIWLAEAAGLTAQDRETAYGPLTRAERDRVQLHPALTGQMLRRAAALDALNPVAACHHERADGSGHVKGLASAQLSPAARILAAADRYQAMTQPRAHRPAMSPQDAAAELRRMAAAGEVDGGAAECVLAAAGHPARHRPAARPAGLTAREAEVLALAASGLTTAQIAKRLVISPKTADSHIQHIYAKIGCSTRGAAVLFALEHHLAGQPSAERLRAEQGPPPSDSCQCDRPPYRGYLLTSPTRPGPAIPGP